MIPIINTLPAVTCDTCKACCCKLEVMLMADDDIPEDVTAQDAWGGWVMLRLDDGWCAALDRQTMLCTIYARRPGICRDFEAGDYDCLEERRQLDLSRAAETKPIPGTPSSHQK